MRLRIMWGLLLAMILVGQAIAADVNVQQLRESMARIDAIANGGPTETVATTGGPVKTVAHAIADLAAFVPRGEWNASTNYSLKDLVTQGGQVYACAAAHTSGSDFAVDLAAGKWALHIRQDGFKRLPDYGDSLTAAATAAGSTGTVLVDRAITVSADATLSAGLWATQGGSIAVASGKSLVVNGPIVAGPWQIFSGAGTVSGSPKVERVLPQWFGAKGDGENDDTVAINKAFGLAKAARVPVYLPQGVYRVTSTIWVQSGLSGAGEMVSLIKPDAATAFTLPVMVATGLGHTGLVSEYTFAAGYAGTYFETSVGAIKAAMVANSRLCPWGVRISDFSIQADARASVKQNGLLLQHLAAVDVRNIGVRNMNGFGLVEDGLQDCVLTNMSIYSNGRDNGAGDQVAQWIIGQFWSSGGFDNTSRIVHRYIQSEVATYRNIQTEAVGSSGAGRGGSTLNVFEGLHCESNILNPTDNNLLSGMMDQWLGGSLTNTTTTVQNGGWHVFIGVDMADKTLVVAGTSGSPVRLVGSIFGGTIQHKTGDLYLDGFVGTYSAVASAGAGKLYASNCNMLYQTAKQIPAEIVGGKLAFGSLVTNQVNFHMSGGEVTTNSAVPAGGLFNGTLFSNSAQLLVAYSLPEFQACKIVGGVALAGGALYVPLFVGCDIAGVVDNGAGGSADTGARFQNCNFDNDVKVGAGAGKVFHSVIAAGKTISAAIKAGNYTTAGAGA